MMISEMIDDELHKILSDLLERGQRSNVWELLINEVKAKIRELYEGLEGNEHEGKDTCPTCRSLFRLGGTEGSARGDK